MLSNAESVCAFDVKFGPVTLMCLDSCTVFFMLSGLPPPQSTPVIHCNWTAQQGRHRWLDEKEVWAFSEIDDLDRGLFRFPVFSVVYVHVINVCLMEPAVTPRDVSSGLTFTDNSSIFMMATVVLTPAQVEAQGQLRFIAATFHIV